MAEIYSDIFGRAVTPVSFPSNEAMYSKLCDSHILLDDGNLSFSLELQQSSYKKCWMLGARHLEIEHSETPEYWAWKSIPESRFSEVAELNQVWFFDIKGAIETSMLSPETPYAAFLVYRFQPNSQVGFRGRPIQLCVSKEGHTVERTVLLDSLGDRALKRRADGFWMEKELDDNIFNNGDDAAVDFCLLDHNTGIKKSGLIVEGIELRPKP